MRYLGIDLHSNNFTICSLAEDGTYILKMYLLKELEAFKRTLRSDDRGFCCKDYFKG